MTAWVARFTGTERAVHWIYTVLFLVLLGTGLALWVPSLSVAVGNRDVVRQVHIVTGLALLPVPLAVAVAGDRRAVLRTAREIDRFDRDDGAFLLRRPSAPGRFNGGQKLNAVWSATAAVLLLASGLVQWQWTRVPASWRAGASEVHDLLTVLSAAVLVGHVWLAPVHRSTRHSLRGIVGGRVRREWAAAHHPRWAVTSDEDG